jgi:uncharacterized membrane protein HdeD (DUF308 family)
VALRGGIVLLSGLAILLLPGLVLAMLGLLVGLYALVDGTLTFVPALMSSDRGRWLPLAEGATGILVVAAWAVLTGVLKVLTTVVMRPKPGDRRPMILGGTLSVLFGLVLGAVLTALSDTGVSSLARLAGALAVVVGLALISFSLRLRDRMD